MKKISTFLVFIFIFCAFLFSKEVFSSVEDSLEGYTPITVDIDGVPCEVYYREIFARPKDGEGTERKSTAEYLIKDRQSGDTYFFVRGKRSSPYGRFYDIYWPRITKDEVIKGSILQKIAIEKNVYEATCEFRSIFTQIDNELYPD